jgi:hypothetical protein
MPRAAGFREGRESGLLEAAACFDLSGPEADKIRARLPLAPPSAERANPRDAVVEAAREWVTSRRALREWLHDKSTPPDEAETDRRFSRVEAAEKAAASALRALSGDAGPGGKATP